MFPLKATSQRYVKWCEHTPSRKQRDRMAEKQRIKKLKSAMRKQVNDANKKVGY